MKKLHAIKADYFLYGIQTGILPFEKAVQWADEVIHAENAPYVEIIDLALSGSKGRNGVMDALKEIPGERDLPLSGSYLLGELKQKLSAGGNLKEIARKAANAAFVTQQPEEEYFRFVAIDDGIGLAETGVYGTVVQCEQDLRRALSKYKSWDEM